MTSPEASESRETPAEGATPPAQSAAPPGEGAPAGTTRPGGTRQKKKGYIETPLGRFVDAAASRAIGIIVNVLVIFTVILLIWSVVALAIVVVDTVQQKDATAIKSLILGILTVFIIIEIFDLFREYLRSAHIRVTNLAEVSLAVVLRELWLLLLEGSSDYKLYLALAAVVAALAGFWWLAHRDDVRDKLEPAATEAVASPPGDRPAPPAADGASPPAAGSPPAS